MDKALCGSLGLKKYIKIFDKFKLCLGPHSTSLWIPVLSQGLGKPVFGYCTGDTTLGVFLPGLFWLLNVSITKTARVSLPLKE